MKTFIISAFAFLILMIESESKSCHSESDCPEGTCCLLSSSNPASKGICFKLGKAGSICSEPEAKLDYLQGKYLSHCPCKDDLVCKPKSGIDVDKSEFSKYIKSLRCQADDDVKSSESPVTDEKSTEEPVTEEKTPETTVTEQEIQNEV